METTQLTNLQKELLKTFSFELSEGQLKEVKTLLSKYFAQKATEEVDVLWEKNKWTEDIMNEWLNEHLRSKK